MSGIELTPLLAGVVNAPSAFAYGLGALRGPSVEMPYLAFLIRHPGRGPILVDTGLHPDAHASLFRDMGPLMGTIQHGLRPEPESFDAQLRAAGVEPDEVESVVMTHLHGDHTSGMRLLPRARFIVGTREWGAAHAPRASLAGYVSDHLPSEDRVRLLDLEPAQEHDLLGDGTIRLIGTPGHTHGHLSVHVQSASGPVLLAGDAIYSRRNLTEDLLPLLSADRRRQRSSMELLRSWEREHPDGLLVPTHDAYAWRAI